MVAYWQEEIRDSEIQMYRLLACRNFGEMNVSLISMKNVIFLLGNPPSKSQKAKNFRACGALSQ